MVMHMSRTLDIPPLRSLVAVADSGGFQRAATSLHLSQAAVSQHVRRLEAATGRVLVERIGRGSRFTRDGEQLVGYARRLLAVHDEAMRSFGVETEETFAIGSTEHAAAQLLPRLAETLEESLPAGTVHFRIDRGTALRESLLTGRLDLALLLGPADDPRAIAVGDLELTWFCAPGWRRPDGPVPLVAFDSPCQLRSRALETLADHGIPASVGAEANQLAGVHAAVGAGLGVALLATLGQTPAGLDVCHELPSPQPLPLAVWSRRGLDARLARSAATTLRRLLAVPPSSPRLLAQGA